MNHIGIIGLACMIAVFVASPFGMLIASKNGPSSIVVVIAILVAASASCTGLLYTKQLKSEHIMNMAKAFVSSLVIGLVILTWGQYAPMEKKKYKKLPMDKNGFVEAFMRCFLVLGLAFGLYIILSLDV